MGLMELIHHKNYRFLAHDVDYRGKPDILSLLNCLMDSAVEHASKLGYSIQTLHKKNLTWVLSRYHVRLSHYPAWNETVNVSTWPSGKQGNFALRDFELKDSQDLTIMRATSSWMLIDTIEKKPVDINEHIPDKVSLDRRALDECFQTMPKLSQTHLEREFDALFRDLDMNRHVNNSVYIRWALETVPVDTLFSLLPVEIEVGFRAEALYGERIKVKTEVINQNEDQQEFIHQILNAETQKEYTRLKTIWR
ncbi:acyl-[acyl-carrier-protein] thioesterase [Acidobacteriota bacterium]